MLNLLSSSSKFFHPVIISVLQILTTTCTVGFTSKQSLIRPASLPVVAVLVFASSTKSSAFLRKTWASPFSGWMVVLFLQHIDLTLLSNVSCVEDGREMPKRNDSKRTTPPQIRSIWQHFTYGLRFTLSFRQINTPFQAKNVPTFSRDDPKYTPSRNAYLARYCIIIFLYTLLLDAFEYLPQSKNPEELFSDARIPLLTEPENLSPNRMAVRIFSTLFFWGSTYVFASWFYGVPALFHICLGLAPVNDWPPYFGSVCDSSTVRGFWGTFWHQGFRRSCTSAAVFVTSRVLRLSKGSIIRRYLELTLVFLISGLAHAAIDVATERPLMAFATMEFFLIQALGIIFEDTVQSLYRAAKVRSSGSLNEERMPQILSWTKALGYLWVVIFLVWSTPTWIYPMMRQPRGAPLLPFGPVKFLVLLSKLATENVGGEKRLLS